MGMSSVPWGRGDGGEGAGIAAEPRAIRAGSTASAPSCDMTSRPTAQLRIGAALNPRAADVSCWIVMGAS
eukprot:733810-Pyramimonas_sp.AAC.1